MNGSKLILFCCLFGFVLWGVSQTQSGAQANTGPIWQDVSLRSVTSVRSASQPLPTEFRLLRANFPSLRQELLTAPEILSGSELLELELPLPNGEFGRFAIQTASILEPELAAKYPQIQTFVVQGLDDATATGRLDVTPAGFHGFIQSAAGDIFIDPYAAGDVEHYISYFKTDSARLSKQYVDFAPNFVKESKLARSTTRNSSTGDIRRVYQIAMSATGEFSDYICNQGADCSSEQAQVASALAAIVTGMNRVTEIYEREVSISFVIVNGSDDLIFTNPTTDPYTNGLDAEQMLDDFAGAGEGRIEVGAYDLGHVISGGDGANGGIAYPFSCDSDSNGLKLTGATALDEPVGDPFWVDYVAHEIGHQFYADHSYNASTAGACTTRVGSTAFEPAGGTTIMSYVGICEGQNLQDQADAMFNAGAYDQILDFVTNPDLGGSSCADLIDTGNTAPTVNAGADYTIPADTPFTLTAAVTDADQAADAITVSWEQYGFADSPSGGVAWSFADILPNTDQQDGAKRSIVRVLPPSSSLERTIPQIANILDGTYQNDGEDLPTVAQEMVFRATARDNAVSGGGVGIDSMTLTVEENAGPFRVTSHSTTETNEIIETNQPIAVNWNVASTDQPPVSCSSVTISFSTDGGQTFDYVLGTETPNDGSETLLVPSTLPVTTNGRIKVACANNIFFDISKGDLEVVEGEPIDFTDMIFLPNVVR